jgi:hypothetical protein
LPADSATWTGGGTDPARLDRIYDAPFAPELWPSVLEDLAESERTQVRGVLNKIRLPFGCARRTKPRTLRSLPAPKAPPQPRAVCAAAT